MPKKKGDISIYEPNDRDATLAEFLPMVGVTYKEIAKIIGITEPTFIKYYGEIAKQGHRQKLAKIAERVMKDALYGDTKEWRTSAYFILKTQAGWRETNKVEMSGENGGPIQLQAVNAPKQETYDEWCANYEKRRLAMRKPKDKSEK